MYSLTLCCSCGRGTPSRPAVPVVVGRGREWRWDCRIGPDGDGLMLERVWPEEEDNTPWGWTEVRGGKPTGAISGARPSICSFICLLSQLITAVSMKKKIHTANVVNVWKNNSYCNNMLKKMVNFHLRTWWGGSMILWACSRTIINRVLTILIGLYLLLTLL